MVPYGPPDIKFSVQIPKSPFGDIENSGVNILPQIMKLFPDNFGNFQVFPYKTSLITLFVETFP